MVCIGYFWQGNHQIYGYIRCREITKSPNVWLYAVHMYSLANSSHSLCSGAPSEGQDTIMARPNCICITQFPGLFASSHFRQTEIHTLIRCNACPILLQGKSVVRLKGGCPSGVPNVKKVKRLVIKNIKTLKGGCPSDVPNVKNVERKAAHQLCQILRMNEGRPGGLEFGGIQSRTRRLLGRIRRRLQRPVGRILS